MKKLSAVIMLLLCFSPFACNRPLTPDAPQPLPTPTFTVTPDPATSTPSPSPTPTGTSVCGFTSVTIQTPPNYGTPGPGTPTATPFPTLALTPGPVLPLPSGTVTPGYTFNSPPLIVIRSQADWQAFYGSSPAPTAPVDFTTTMLIIYKRSLCPCNNLGVVQVCADSSYVTVTFGNVGPYCWATCPQPATWGLAGVAVPQSSLPVTWFPNFP